MFILRSVIDEAESLKQKAELLEGKLLRREEIPLDEEVIHQLLTNHLLSTKPSIIKKFLMNQCGRCGNTNKKYFAQIPCNICYKTHLYCRNCIEMGRIMECQPLYFWAGPPAEWYKYENPCTWSGTLTPAQQLAADRIRKAIINQETEMLVWAVCGAGKTEMLFPGLAEALEKGKRICIATPRADVVRELKPRLEKAFEKVSIHGLYGGSEDKAKNAQLMIATTHQLLRFRKAFDVMVIDEVDAFPFHSDPSLQFAARRSIKDTSTTIYLTATPRKSEQTRIFQGKLPHVFVPIRYHGHPLPVPKMEMTSFFGKERLNGEIPKSFILWLSKRSNPQRQLLVFVPVIHLTEKIKPYLTNILIEQKVIHQEDEVDFVHSEDPDREDKVIAFRKKAIKAIVTTTILERGVTFPSVDVAVLHADHEVFDEAALVQIAGRAGRSADDPTGEVVFFHDGKTDAMVSAISMIKQMNKRGRMD